MISLHGDSLLFYIFEQFLHENHSQSSKIKMNWKIVLQVCMTYLVFACIASGDKVTPKCGLVYEEGGIGVTGFIKEKLTTKAATEGPVCPDKCGTDFLTEVNTQCEANFTATCVESCDDTIPRIEETTVTEGTGAPPVSYNNCCIVQGPNKEGDFNSYTFVDKDGIILVGYLGNPTS